MGLISRVSSRTYRYFLVRKKKPTFFNLKWFNESPTNDDCVGTPAPTKRKSSKPPAENWPSNTPANKVLSPNAVTPAKNCKVSKLTDPNNWLLAEPNDELRPFLELTVVSFPLKL